MQTATSEAESKSLDLSICVHHYTLRAPCPKGQGIWVDSTETFGLSNLGRRRGPGTRFTLPVVGFAVALPRK